MVKRRSKLVESINIGAEARLVGHSGFGLFGLDADGDEKAASVRKIVTDGDTVSVRALDNVPVRFLGVDAPEKGLFRPDPSDPRKEKYVPLSQTDWDDFLISRLADGSLLATNLPPTLLADLRRRVQPGVRANHKEHADSAETALQNLLQRDLDDNSEVTKDFRFYHAYAWEALDRYGRLLCFLNRQEENRARRKRSYNERMLEKGMVSPYFIWPNIDPFREQANPFSDILKPQLFWAAVNSSATLSWARETTARARQSGLGIFDTRAPLSVAAFELRFITRGQPPDRFVIDLGNANNILLTAHRYLEIAREEDRLFVAPEYVPLFKMHGWTVA